MFYTVRSCSVCEYGGVIIWYEKSEKDTSLYWRAWRKQNPGLFSLMSCSRCHKSQLHTCSPLLGEWNSGNTLESFGGGEADKVWVNTCRRLLISFRSLRHTWGMCWRLHCPEASEGNMLLEFSYVSDTLSAYYLSEILGVHLQNKI